MAQYVYPGDLTAGTLAKSSDVNARVSGLTAAVNNVDGTQLQAGVVALSHLTASLAGMVVQSGVLPASPLAYQPWIDSGDGALKIYNSATSAWERRPKITISTTATGAPTTNLHAAGDFHLDSAYVLWQCTATGTPGTWQCASKIGREFEVANLVSLTSPMSSTATAAAGTANLVHSVVNVSSAVTYEFEVTMYATSGGTAYAGLWDWGTGALVAGSTVNTTATGVNVLRASSIALTAGHFYTLALWTSNASYAAQLTQARVVGVL